MWKAAIAEHHTCQTCDKLVQKHITCIVKTFSLLEICWRYVGDMLELGLTLSMFIEKIKYFERFCDLCRLEQSQFFLKQRGDKVKRNFFSQMFFPSYCPFVCLKNWFLQVWVTQNKKTG